MEVLMNMSMDQTTSAQLRPALPPAPPPRKYTSVFRIDGVPILPPLMTSEKRRQMRKLKEKALEVEQKLEEKRRRKIQFADEVCQLRPPGEEVTGPEEGAEVCPSSARSKSSNASMNSYDLSASDSYLMLSNLMRPTMGEPKTFVHTSTCTLTETAAMEKSLEERMQKLQKSETLIYDNRSNTIIMPMSKLEEDQQLQQEQQQQEDDLVRKMQNALELKEVLENPAISYRHMPKPIPSICVNPPTPLVGTTTFCDTLSASGSFDSAEIGDLKLHQPSVLDDVSSDESMNASQQSSNSSHVLKAHKKITNITAKIIQFENLQEEGGVHRITLESPCNQPPQRSATSPSLKLASPNRISSSPLSSTPNSANQILRSNSFTLDGPSKALLEHIRQQKAAAAQHNGHGVKRSCSSPSASAIRDTVESKAKRVQKLELKPRPPPMRATSKPNLSTSSPYGAKAGHNNHSNSSSVKTKRSPYELKSSSKLVCPMKKTATGAVVLKQIKTRASMPSVNTHARCTASNKNNNNNNIVKSKSNTNHNNNNISLRSTKVQPELLSEIEAEHRQKFLQLIAQQQEEQKRLQEAFEAQQKILLEQLTVDMDKVQLTPSGHGHGHGNAALSSLETSPAQSSSVSYALNSEFGDLHPISPTLSLSSSMLSQSLVSSANATCEAAEESSCTSTATTLATSRHCTPRRRLFPRDHSPATAVGVGSISSTSSVASRRLRQHLDNERRIAAATKINACARGFLTRRLFQTEQIQRIVQTIRDTLIFVLNLHMETVENPEEANTPANIKLKSRLLQQLSSASRTLHLVFFQTTTKERMEIIARDRKRIKTKLLTMNRKRTPRIAA